MKQLNYTTKSILKKREFSVLAGVLILMFSALYLLNILHPEYEALRFERMSSFAGKILVYFLFVLLIFQVVFLLYMAFRYFKYRPIKAVEDSQLPICTVIVPAYNEGALVYHTLKSIANSDYPKNKLEVIAIDDGSQDDTWSWIVKAKEELGDFITIYKQPQNMGKREALYRGFTTGKGKVFITIDSDSIIEENTIRNMVSPFVIEDNCGAVAGNVKVLNKNESMISRMLNVSFVFSFEFIRAAQSSHGFVLCTPGALSAYRREAVMHSLDEWINQTFLGQKATIGEDRAMTNLILKQGYDVRFQKDANVLTNTPTAFKTLHKMFTRWGRSNVRETLMMNKFAFSNFKSGNKIGERFIFINQWVKLLLAFPIVLLMFYFLFSNPVLYITSALASAFIFSSIQMIFFSVKYNFKDSLWAYPYSVFYMFALFWIFPFSIVTVKNGGWLTR